MKLGIAIADVREAEMKLGRWLDAIGERHRADADVHHLAGTLQRIAHANLDRLASHAERHDAAERSTTGATLSDRGLLWDLCDLHVVYAEASIKWVVLGQGAQAARDAALLEVVSRSHAQTLRGMKWTVTRIKTAAPQVLTS